MACDEHLVFEENRAITDRIWNKDAVLEFDFNVDDTVNFHNMFINVRNEESYPYSNLFVFVDIEFPNGKRSLDTVELPLADPTGRWYGSGFGGIYDSRIRMPQPKIFPIAGPYRVKIQQAMRHDDLEGIVDVGFRVSRVAE
jgi:gliding motility-associated lipoprotein GldH